MMAGEDKMGNSPFSRLRLYADRLLAASTALFLAAVAPATLSAQEFYAGKRLTLLVNFDPGGPTDIEARLIARHIARHIPGQPAVIVQNMAGAGGLVGTRYLGEKGPKDGTMVGYFSGSAQRYVSNPERFTVDYLTYEFVAVVPNGRIHFVRSGVKPGINAPADILKAENIVVGGLGADSAKDLAMRLTLDMLGVPYKYVTGYNSSARAMLAMQRGEIDFFADSPPVWVGQVVPTLVTKGEAVGVWLDPAYDGKSFLMPRPLKGIGLPPFHEFYRSVKGRQPSGPLWDAYLSILTVNGAMYRIMAMPPGTPKEAVTALRTAMARLNDDPAYLDEAQKAIGEAPEYVAHARLNEDVGNALVVSPALKAFFADYIKRIDKR